MHKLWSDLHAPWSWYFLLIAADIAYSHIRCLLFDSDWRLACDDIILIWKPLLPHAGNGCLMSVWFIRVWESEKRKSGKGKQEINLQCHLLFSSLQKMQNDVRFKNLWKMKNDCRCERTRKRKIREREKEKLQRERERERERERTTVDVMIIFIFHECSVH